MTAPTPTVRIAPDAPVCEALSRALVVRRCIRHFGHDGPHRAIEGPGRPEIEWGDDDGPA